MFAGIVNIYIYKTSSDYIYKNSEKIPGAYVALVPGAKVYKNKILSYILYDRLKKALYLYKKKKVKRILLSGDHGRDDYDEVNAMKSFLLETGVPAKDIFMDHAGFRTYDSIYRAANIFEVKDMIVVSQGYHLYRAVYLARSMGIKAYGYRADKRKYRHMILYEAREVLANVKAFLDILFHNKPRFGGEKIPIAGDSQLSWD